MTPSEQSVRDQALVLRSAGASIRVIASALDLPRSTVGDMLRGVGAPSYYVICEQCGQGVIAARSHARYCSHRCACRAWRERRRS